MTDEESAWNWIRILELSLGIVSILGCFFVLFVYFYYKKLRSFQFELIANLTFSSLVASFSYLLFYIPLDVIDLSKYNKDCMCQAQAFIMVWSETSEYTWAALIGYSVYQSVINFEENKKKTNWTKRIKYLFCGYVIPFAISLTGLFLDTYGAAGQWCWVESNTQRGIIFASVIYWMQWVLILVNFILNWIVVRFLDLEMKSQEEKELVKKYMWKLLRYPIIQAICLLPASINRFVKTFLKKQFFILDLLHMIFVITQGLCYAINYGYTPQVRNAIYETFTNCYCCDVKSRRQSESSLKSKTESLNISVEERTLRNNESNII